MIAWLRQKKARLYFRWRVWRDTAGDLNRRVTVENELSKAANGETELPSAADCRRMAQKLAIPDELCK